MLGLRAHQAVEWEEQLETSLDSCNSGLNNLADSTDVLQALAVALVPGRRSAGVSRAAVRVPI